MRQNYFLWSNKKLTLTSLTIILLSSCSFGLWFKIKQISITLEKIIEVQEAQIENLQKQIQEWEEWKASSKDRHAKGREKSQKPHQVE
tara:strand:- start:794 stop:1057 length:264 start_codon:yes stop_codon:yes gene_type:complete